MTKHDFSSRHFQRKISEFCELRFAPIASTRVLKTIRPYLASLIIYRKSPPCMNGHIDWAMVGQACGIVLRLLPRLTSVYPHYPSQEFTGSVFQNQVQYGRSS